MEHTGGHWLDTGDRGPRPLTGLALLGGTALREQAEMTAYRAYLDHATTCTACPESTFKCATAAELWAAYRQARGWAPATTTAVLGTCHCCQTPVHQGEERRETFEHATGAAPEVLLHRRPCTPVNGRHTPAN